MNSHSCKTYFTFDFAIDTEKNAAILRARRDCEPEELGILNKDEVADAIKEAFGVTPEWDRLRFVIGLNADYSADVNEMIRVTLKDITGKEDKVKDICGRFSLTSSLKIVPCIAKDSRQPSQNLSLDGDIIEFLYKSGAAMDLDYYTV